MITDSQVLESYRHHLTVSPRRYAPGTIRSYVNMADRYMHAVPDWATCGVLTVEQFVYGLDRTDSSKRDANAAVRRFYRWAVREGLAGSDPTATVELPRMKPRVPRPMSDGDVKLALLYAAYVEDERMTAMLALMAGCGLRCCEVAAADWADLDRDGQRMVVHGKGDRERIVPVPPSVADALERVERRSRAVFVSPATGKRYTPTRVSQLVNQHLKAAGVSGTAHTLRHWYATERLTAAGSLEIVRDLLGHSSVTTTENYAALAPGLRFDYRPVEVPGL